MNRSLDLIEKIRPSIVVTNRCSLTGTLTTRDTLHASRTQYGKAKLSHAEIVRTLQTLPRRQGQCKSYQSGKTTTLDSQSSRKPAKPRRASESIQQDKPRSGAQQVRKVPADQEISHPPRQAAQRMAYPLLDRHPACPRKP